MSELDDLYTETINAQRDYLAKLQEAFNLHCDEITAKAEEKLRSVPETDVTTRQKVYQEQKSGIDEALAQLKNEIDSSNSRTRKKLEEIHTRREAIKLQELEDLMNKA